MNLPNIRQIFKESRSTGEERRIKNNSFYKFCTFVTLSITFIHLRNKNFNLSKKIKKKKRKVIF